MFSRLGKKEILSETGVRVRSDVVAADARFFDAFRMKVARGRAFTEEDNRGQAAVCVVGHKLVDKLGPRSARALPHRGRRCAAA